MNLQTPYVPDLYPDKISPWHPVIDFQAQGLAMSEQNNNVNYHTDQLQHMAVAAMTGAMLASLPKQISSEIITRRTVINPAILIQKVSNYITKEFAADQHRLKIESEDTYIGL